MKKEIRFSNERETANTIIELQKAGSLYRVVGRTAIVVDALEPALVLPPTFVWRLRSAIARKGLQLIGAARHKNHFNIFISGRTIEMEGSFSVNDVMEKL